MKKKLRFLVDEDTRFILDMDGWDMSVANFETLADAELSYTAEDEDILAAGQRMDRIVLTKDQGGGYHERTVFSPTYNKTGVVIVQGKPEQIPMVVINVSKNLSLDQVIRARTTASTQMARIRKAGKGYVVKWE